MSVVLLGIAGVVCLVFKLWLWMIALFISATVLFLICGIEIVSEEDRLLIERLGRFYKVKGPGPLWICPIIMKVRAAVSIWEQPIELFEEHPSIDFKEGGTAILVDPIVWVRIKGVIPSLEEDIIRQNVYKMIYAVGDWRGAIRKNFETALRTYLNNRTIENTLKAILSRNKNNWWDELKKQFPKLGDETEALGLKLTRLTISDFGWSKEVIATRQEVFDAMKSVKVAEHRVKAARKEIIWQALKSGGFHAEIKKVLVNDYSYDPKEAEKIATIYVQYFKAADTGSLVDWRSSGEGKNTGLTGLFAQIAAAGSTGIKKAPITAK